MRLPHLAAGLERRHVEHAQPHADHQVRMLVADPGDDRVAEQPRAAVEVAAEPAGPHASAEELVQQVAVAGLDVDELEADLVGQPGRGDVRVDQPLQIVVGPDDRIVVRVDAELGVQQRMVVGDPRLQLLRVAAGRSGRNGSAAGRPADRRSCRSAGGGPSAVRSSSAARPARFSGVASVWFGLARPSGCTAAASPPQISLAPLSPKFRQRRSVCGDGEPSRLASQPSIGWMHQRLPTRKPPIEIGAASGEPCSAVRIWSSTGRSSASSCQPRAKRLDALQLRDFRI